jgi:hypothetical protein
MADRGQLVEAAGTIGAKPRVGEPRAVARRVDVDIGADDQHQRTARAARLGDDGLGEHLPQGGLAGGIAGLVAAGEVEEQVHEFGRRRVARLRRRRRGDEQQAEREAGETEISHASIPSVAL